MLWFVAYPRGHCYACVLFAFVLLSGGRLEMVIVGLYPESACTRAVRCRTSRNYVFSRRPLESRLFFMLYIRARRARRQAMMCTGEQSVSTTFKF